MSENFVEYLILTMWYGSSFSNHTRAGLVDGVSVEKNIQNLIFHCHQVLKTYQHRTSPSNNKDRRLLKPQSQPNPEKNQIISVASSLAG